MHNGSAIDESMNLSMSAKGLPLYEAVVDFIRDEVEPVTLEFFRLGEGRAEHWGYGEGQLELVRRLVEPSAEGARGRAGHDDRLDQAAEAAGVTRAGHAERAVADADDVELANALGDGRH